MRQCTETYSEQVFFLEVAGLTKLLTCCQTSQPAGTAAYRCIHSCLVPGRDALGSRGISHPLSCSHGLRLVSGLARKRERGMCLHNKHRGRQDWQGGLARLSQRGGRGTLNREKTPGSGPYLWKEYLSGCTSEGRSQERGPVSKKVSPGPPDEKSQVRVPVCGKARSGSPD